MADIDPDALRRLLDERAAVHQRDAARQRQIRADIRQQFGARRNVGLRIRRQQKEHQQKEKFMTTTTRSPMDPRLEDLLERAGQELYRNLLSGYTDGYESTLAERLLDEHLHAESDALPQLIEATLHQLVHDKLMGLAVVDCLLDETSDGSYSVIGWMADRLMAEILAQDNALPAIGELVKSDIVSRAERYRRGYRQLDDPADPARSPHCSGCPATLPRDHPWQFCDACMAAASKSF